jgi:zinc protease
MKNRMILVFVLGLVSACQLVRHGSEAKTEATIKAGAPSRTQFRNERIETLPNGLKIFFVDEPSLPRVSLQLLLPVGSITEPADRPGLNSMTASLLDQGTAKKKALELSDLFADSGAEFEATPGADFTVLSTSSLTTEFPRVLDLFTEVLLAPQFPSEEVERLRQQFLVALKGRQDRPGPWADFIMQKNFYQNHPYGRDSLGTEASVSKINRQEILQFYRNFYVPNGARLAVTGRLSPSLESKIKRAFLAWSPSSKFQTRSLPFLAEGTGTVLKMPSPHKAQTEIRFIQTGVSRNDPNYLKLRLVNEILGGSFASRLNQRVRDDLGLTYSIYSYLDPRKEGGAWIISTFSKNPTAQKTVDEVFVVLKAIIQDGVTADELKAAKNLARAQFPRSIETADRLAYNLMALDFYGLGVDYLINYDQNIEAITLADANKALRDVLNPHRMQVLIYGQPETGASEGPPQLK